MSSNVAPGSSQQPTKGGLSLFTLSDHELLNQIYATHVHNDEKFDVESLFIIVENTLKHSAQIVDNVVLGDTHAPIEHLEDKAPKASFSTPLCTLKSLSCEMQCKAPGEEIAHKTTLSILNKLSNYSWDAKAVLTLAAFALEYGEFWLLSQIQPSDQLAKSVGILRRVPVLLNRPTLQKRRKALIELNNVIKTTLEVIECVFELEKLSIYDTKDVPALATGTEHIPVDVYWAIVTVVASTTQLCSLTSDEEKTHELSPFHINLNFWEKGDKTQELSPFAQKLNIILAKLKRQITICRQQIDQVEAHRKLEKLFRTPTEIMEVFKGLIYTKDNVQPLIDGSTKKLVDIEVLKRKNVLLFISGLDISDDDISILKPVHDAIKKEDQHKIVWIPIVDEWTDDLRKKFEILRSKMPWYSVQHSSPIAGTRFIKEKWNFKNKPSVVVLNPQGKVESENAIHMIRVWGVKAFPFTSAVEETLSKSKDWIGSVATSVHPNIQNWIKEDKYIFFYGGKDNEWIQQFTKRATVLANDPVIKEAKISIELLLVGKGSKGEDHLSILGRFWTGIESLFMSKTQRKTETDVVSLEIQKLLSLKNESGWAVLSKGSTVVFSGHGTTVLKALEEFETWKQVVREKGFEFVLKEHHNKVLQTSHICCRIDVPSVSGKVPENMKCPDCPHVMETFISFKCCHLDGALNGHH